MFRDRFERPRIDAHLCENRACKRARLSGFTLVELLVVIGIIALLISILLPALQAARRQANAVKCAAELREIGHAFQMYAADSKGWFPPAQLQTLSGKVYNIDGTDFPQQGVGAYWFHFLQKYVTKSKLGFASSNASDRADARRSILWGCPSWEGYQSGGYTGGVNVNQPGYGMNAWPTFTPSVPPPPGNHPDDDGRVFIQNWPGPGQIGNFVKQVVWGKRGAERCLVADSIFWEVDSQRVDPTIGMLGQALMNNSVAAGNHAFAIGNTLIDAYRHGKYPDAMGDGKSFKKIGGKVAFNILYSDGHVVTSVDRTEAFRSVRQRYPE
jgi:prepilin-type N-terminal cleavage/methylation domain-containing protein/prepilin-type processing-associated H-X9-DG protein